MIGGQGRLFGRAVTSFIGNLAFVVPIAPPIMAKSLTVASRLTLRRDNKRATVTASRTSDSRRYAVMPSSRAAVSPSMPARSASLSPGVERMWSTEVWVHGNG